MEKYKTLKKCEDYYANLPVDLNLGKRERKKVDYKAFNKEMFGDSDEPEEKEDFRVSSKSDEDEDDLDDEDEGDFEPKPKAAKKKASPERKKSPEKAAAAPKKNRLDDVAAPERKKSPEKAAAAAPKKNRLDDVAAPERKKSPEKAAAAPKKNRLDDVAAPEKKKSSEKAKSPEKAKAKTPPLKKKSPLIDESSSEDDELPEDIVNEMKKLGLNLTNAEMVRLAINIDEVQNDKKYKRINVYECITRNPVEASRVPEDTAQICGEIVSTIARNVSDDYKKLLNFREKINPDPHNPLSLNPIGPLGGEATKEEFKIQMKFQRALDAAASYTSPGDEDNSEYRSRYVFKEKKGKGDNVKGYYSKLEPLTEEETNEFVEELGDQSDVLKSLKNKLEPVTKELIKQYLNAELGVVSEDAEEATFVNPSEAALAWIGKHTPEGTFQELLEAWLEDGAVGDEVLTVSKRVKKEFDDINDVEKDQNFVKSLWAALTSNTVGPLSGFGVAYLASEAKIEKTGEADETLQRAVDNARSTINAALKEFQKTDVDTLSLPSSSDIDKFVKDAMTALHIKKERKEPGQKKEPKEKKLTKTQLQTLCDAYNEGKPVEQQIYYSKSWAADKLAERCSEAAITAIKESGILPPGRGGKVAPTTTPKKKKKKTQKQLDAEFENEFKPYMVKLITDRALTGKTEDQIREDIDKDEIWAVTEDREKAFVNKTIKDALQPTEAPIKRVSSEDIPLGVLLERKLAAEKAEKAKLEKERKAAESREKKAAEKERKAAAEKEQAAQAQREAERAAAASQQSADEARTKKEQNDAERNKREAERIAKIAEEEKTKAAEKEKKAAEEKKEAAAAVVQATKEINSIETVKVTMVTEKEDKRLSISGKIQKIFNDCQKLFRKELKTRGGKTTEVEQFLNEWMPKFRKHYAKIEVPDATTCVAQFTDAMIIVAYIKGVIEPPKTK